MIEIEVPIYALFAVFEGKKTVSGGEVHEVPGVATIQLAPSRVERRYSPDYGVQAHVLPHLPILIEFAKVGKDVAIGVFSAWLYDRLKSGSRGKLTPTIRINQKTIEITTPEDIVKICEESIEIDRKG